MNHLRKVKRIGASVGVDPKGKTVRVRRTAQWDNVLRQSRLGMSLGRQRCEEE